METRLFNFESQQVRVVTIDGDPWFVGKDVATILGYSNASDALARHVDDEDQKVLKSGNTTLENVPNRGLTIINESGLYSLILSSKLPTAKKFKRWVTSEVLPTIRKHGAYMTPEKLQEVLLNPDTLIQLATELKKEREGRLIAENQVKLLQPKATYLDIILGTPDTMATTQIAADYGYGAKEFNKLLNKVGIQHKVNGQWILYKVYMGQGYVTTKVFTYKNKKGNVGAKPATYWTQKGRKLIYDVLKENDVLPLIEREDIA